jgi:hypothetical protein
MLASRARRVVTCRMELHGGAVQWRNASDGGFVASMRLPAA